MKTSEERNTQASAQVPTQAPWNPQEAQRLIDDLPDDLEWDVEKFEAGEQEDSADYVDGWNDGIAHARAIAEQLQSAIDHLSSGSDPPRVPGPGDLSEREREVAGLVVRGLLNKEIAGKLGISEHTVKFHLLGAMTKMRSSTRTELAFEVIRQGEIRIPLATETEIAARRASAAQLPARIRTKADASKARARKKPQR